MHREPSARERRRFRRFDLDWPLEYRVTDAPGAYGGILVDGSETGFRIHSVKDMSVGTRLNVLVLFKKEFQLNYFEVVARVVWRDVCLKRDWTGYQYGLEFVEISKEDLKKLPHLLPLPIRYGES